MTGAENTERCPQCRTELAPLLLSCPSCGRLIHSDELKRLAADASRFESVDDTTSALTTWRRALELLPPGTNQVRMIEEKISGLGRNLNDLAIGGSPAIGAPSASGQSKAPKWLAGWGVAGVFLWKLKFMLVFVATKAKILLLGLSKAGTVISMLATMGVYWTFWGWRFAVGFVLSIYVHEMGHVAALRRFGIKADPPMFIPGVGAFVRLRQMPANPREDATVGLAGPNWGLAAALACYTIFIATRQNFWAALAGVGAWVNLFNLLPLGGLDGGRAFRAMSRSQRWIAVAMLGGAWYFSREGLLILLLVVAIVRAGSNEKPAGDRNITLNYLGLVLLLTALTNVRPMGM